MKQPSVSKIVAVPFEEKDDDRVLSAALSSEEVNSHAAITIADSCLATSEAEAAKDEKDEKLFVPAEEKFVVVKKHDDHPVSQNPFKLNCISCSDQEQPADETVTDVAENTTTGVSVELCQSSIAGITPDNTALNEILSACDTIVEPESTSRVSPGEIPSEENHLEEDSGEDTSSELMEEEFEGDTPTEEESNMIAVLQARNKVFIVAFKSQQESVTLPTPGGGVEKRVFTLIPGKF